MGTFSKDPRTSDEKDRDRRSVAEEVVKAGLAKSFLAEAKKDLPPDEFERVRQSIIGAQGGWQAPEGRWYEPPPPETWQPSPGQLMGGHVVVWMVGVIVALGLLAIVVLASMNNEAGRFGPP